MLVKEEIDSQVLTTSEISHFGVIVPFRWFVFVLVAMTGKHKQLKREDDPYLSQDFSYP
jgi:hypothetical protein